MQVEVKTISRVTRSGEPELVMTFAFLPRGSGNRGNVRRFAKGLRSNPHMAPHIKRVVLGSSKVTVHFRASLALMKAVNDLTAEHEKTRDVPGQLPLFAT